MNTIGLWSGVLLRSVLYLLHEEGVRLCEYRQKGSFSYVRAVMLLLCQDVHTTNITSFLRRYVVILLV